MDRDSKLLPAYQKILMGQFENGGVRLSTKDCQDLVGFISILEEERGSLKESIKRIKDAKYKSNEVRSTV